MQQTETQHITRSRVSIPRRRADLLTRQRLLDAMDELLDKKIILINAPAGYGKTSLLIDLADDLALPICWYALDTLDQNLPRFLEYLVAAIQVRFPNFNTSLINVLRSSTQKEISIDTAVSILSNDIYDQITEHFIIMLDDYHLIKDDPQVNQFLSQFVQQTEENCHIIFASRSLLNLPDLPLLVARGLVGELDQLDLAFNSHETRDLFFFQHHIVLSDDEADVLQKQTEGWVTGLLLTARTAITRLIPKQKELRATGVNINDYFDLIFNAQNETIQQFLLYTSLLEDFTPSLFTNTIGKQFPHLQEQYQSCVDHILTSNLFVQSIQMDELSLRYHHLFLDYLQNKFKLEDNQLYLEFQVLIAGYYEKTQLWEQAYQIYEQEGMLDRQMAMLENHGPTIALSGHYSTLRTWINQFPESLLNSTPGLCSLFGIVISENGELVNGLKYLSMALDGISLQKEPGLGARTLVRKSTILRILGNYTDSLDCANQAINLVENSQQNKVLLGEAHRAIGGCFLAMGEFHQCLKELNVSLNIFTSVNKIEEITVTQFNLSAVYTELGQYELAKAILLRVISYWEKNGNKTWLANAYYNFGYLLHISDEPDKSIVYLEKAIDLCRLFHDSRLEAIALCSFADIHMDLGLFSDAKNFYLQSLKIGQKIQSEYVIIYSLYHLALASIYQKNPHEAFNHIEDAKQIISNNQSGFYYGLNNYIEGVYYFSLNDYQKALFSFMNASKQFDSNEQKIYICKSALYISITGFLLKNDEVINQTKSLIENNIEKKSNKFVLSSLISHEYFFFEEMAKKHSFINELLLKIYEINKYKEIRQKTIQKIQKSTNLKFERISAIKITTLGSMKVKYNNKTLTSSDWQTQSARDFFFLILSNSAGYTKEEIGLLLWPDDTLQEFRYHFRNAIYRVRHAIGKDSILLDGDIYRFNNDQDFMLDAHEFEQEVQAFLEAKTPEDKQKHYKRANKLYKGSYLPGMDLEIIRLERERLQALYRRITLEMCQFTFSQEDFNNTVTLANQALIQDPCNEEICRLAMKAESARGNRVEIARVFERCENALLNEYDAQPTEQTRKLYHILMRI